MWIRLAFNLVVPLLRRHGMTLGLVAALGLQGFWGYLQTRRHEATIKSLQRTIEDQKESIAFANGAIIRLEEAARNIRPGETRTLFVEVPKFIGYEKPVPVIVTRTEKTIETKIETLTLPVEKIKEIIEKSPQSIIATMTALRDIRQGEKFTVTFAQVGPGLWQPLVTADSPVGIDARVVTPVERIPQPIEARPPLFKPFTVTMYSGYSSMDAWVAGIRPTYRFNPTLSLEGQAECRGLRVSPFSCQRGTDYRVVGTVTW